MQNHPPPKKNDDSNVSDVGAAIGGGILAASLGLGLFGSMAVAAAGFALAKFLHDGENDNES